MKNFKHFNFLIYTKENIYVKIIVGGAPVRCIVYSWWKPNLVIPSKKLVVSLGTEIVRLGLSVDKQGFEP